MDRLPGREEQIEILQHLSDRIEAFEQLVGTQYFGRDVALARYSYRGVLLDSSTFDVALTRGL